MAFPQTARFQELLRRTFGIKGPLSLELAESVLPVLDITQYSPEQELLRGVRMFVGLVGNAPPPGNTGFVRLENPAESGQLLSLERARFSQGTAVGDIVSGIIVNTVGVGAVVQQAMPRDPRKWGPASVPAGQMRSGNVVGAIATVAQMQEAFEVAGGRAPFELLDIVLPPGWSVQFWTNRQGTVINATMYWRERKAEPEEGLA